MTSGTWGGAAGGAYMAAVSSTFPVAIMKNRFFALGLPGLALLLSSTAALAQGVAEQRVVASLPQLDARIEAARRAYDTPALAVAIVSGRRLIHFRGFGTKDAGGKPPDIDTAFRVGSTTKAFVGALLGQQVEQGRLAWSDRVVDVEPGFRLADPAATREFQVIDLLAQRSGLPPYALGYMMALNYPQDAMVRGLAYVQPVAPFRTAFAYQNALHSVAGRIIARKAGTADWAEVLRRDLLVPLGMFNSSVGQGAYLEMPNRAAGYEIDVFSGRPQPTRPDYSSIADMTDPLPAGSLNASAGDMARWLRLQLGRGTLDGQQFLRRDTVEAGWRPLVDIGEGGVFLPGAQVGYATGWMVEQRPDALMVWHNGGLAGFKTDLAFLPDHDLGIVVLSNLSESPATALAVRYFLEYALNLPPQDVMPDPARRLDRPAGRGLRPAADYVGLYANPAGGPARVEETVDGLRIVAAEAAVALRLQPLNDDSFVAFLDLPPRAGIVPQPLAVLSFERDTRGVSAFTFEEDASARFARQR